jgi:hypothetical protein
MMTEEEIVNKAIEFYKYGLSILMPLARKEFIDELVDTFINANPLFINTIKVAIELARR